MVDDSEDVFWRLTTNNLQDENLHSRMDCFLFGVYCPKHDNSLGNEFELLYGPYGSDTIFGRADVFWDTWETNVIPLIIDKMISDYEYINTFHLTCLNHSNTYGGMPLLKRESAINMSNNSVVTTADVAEELRYFADRNIYDALVSQFLRKGIKTKRTERKYVLDHLIGYVGVDSGYAFYPDRETVSDRSEFPLAALNKLFGDIWEFSYSGIRNNFIVTLKQSCNEVVGYIDICSSEGDNVLQLSMFGAEGFVNTLIERTSKTFEPKVTRQCTRFSLNAKGELGTAMISLANPKPYNEGVYVNVGLEPKELLADWYASDSRCVLFWGPAGGGKSSFVSQMLVHRGYSNIVIIDDGDVMQSKELINAIRSLPDGTLVIFEDADILLSKREDGNRQMSGLLNIISGIAERDIRFMFLTNLTSLDREVDEALLRKGRMYKAVKFVAYKPKQVNTVREALNLELLGESVVNTYENWSLADIIHYGTADGVKHQGIGF